MSKKRVVNAWISALLVGGIGAAVVGLAEVPGLYGRIDLTKDQRYTLSQGLVAIVKKLEEPVTVRCYFTEKAPGAVDLALQDARDFLEEVVAASDNKVIVEYVDPSQSTELREMATQTYEVPPTRVDIRQRGSASAVEVFVGMVVLREERWVTIPTVITRGVLFDRSVEYQLAAAIRKMQTTEPPTIGVLAGHQEPPVDGPGLQAFREQAQTLYKVQAVDTTQNGTIPATVSALLVLNPRTLDDRDRFAIDQFVMEGKPVVIQTGKVALDLAAGRLEPIWANPLSELLLHYGAEVKDSLVVSPGGMAFMDPETGQAEMAYVPNLAFNDRNLDADNPATARIELVSAMYATPIAAAAALPEGVTFSRLVWTDPEARSVRDLGELERKVFPPFFEQVQVKDGAQMGETAERTVVAVLEGTWKSFFDGKEVPPQREPTRGAMPPPADGDPILASRQSSRIVVAGSDLAQIAGRGSQNIELLLNIMDWLTLGNDLISIRSKTVDFRPLEVVSEEELDALRKEHAGDPGGLEDAVKDLSYGRQLFWNILCIGLVPVAVLLAGLIRFVVRVQLSKRPFRGAAERSV